MKMNDWKYLADTLLFVGICSLAVTGLLLAFVIPSGKGPEASKYFLGIHRHAWGDIHLYVALSLLAILVLHIWLIGYGCHLDQRLFWCSLEEGVMGNVRCMAGRSVVQ